MVTKIILLDLLHSLSSLSSPCAMLWRRSSLVVFVVATPRNMDLDLDSLDGYMYVEYGQLAVDW